MDPDPGPRRDRGCHDSLAFPFFLDQSDSYHYYSSRESESLRSSGKSEVPLN